MNITEHDELFERVFHEPNRLSIMSLLCASDKGMTFNEIKEACNLTDGNLSRHLRVLEEANVIVITKKFVDKKPRTTVTISTEGLDRFNQYLTALGEILAKAKKAINKPHSIGTAVFNARTARA